MSADSCSNALIQHAYRLTLQIQLLQADFCKTGINRAFNTPEPKAWEELSHQMQSSLSRNQLLLQELSCLPILCTEKLIVYSTACTFRTRLPFIMVEENSMHHGCCLLISQQGGNPTDRLRNAKSFVLFLMRLKPLWLLETVYIVYS